MTVRVDGLLLEQRRLLILGLHQQVAVLLRVVAVETDFALFGGASEPLVALVPLRLEDARFTRKAVVEHRTDGLLEPKTRRGLSCTTACSLSSCDSLPFLFLVFPFWMEAGIRFRTFFCRNGSNAESPP